MDRRSDSRFFCADLVEVKWSESGRQNHRIANLEDISEGGVCLLMEHALVCGTEVAVRCGHGDLKGIVRHCNEREMGFLIGIKLDPDSRWSSQEYRPEHLLDPQDMFSSRIHSRNER